MNENMEKIIESVAKLIVSPGLSPGIEAIMAAEAMISKKWKEEKRKKSVEEWLESFVRNNTGTVADGDAFWKHINDEGLIEKVKRFVFEDVNKVCEIKFITDLTSECYSYCHEHGGQCTRHR